MGMWEEAVAAGPRTVQQVNSRSAQVCGCDEGADHFCEMHADMQDYAARVAAAKIIDNLKMVSDTTGSRLFTTDAQTRKGFPVFTGCLMYFPDAFAAMADVSKAGNDQHNPGEPLHWAREKSTDQMDTATRHMMDHGTGYTKDSDGKYHLAKALWRIAAELQLTIEKERENA